MAPDTHVRMTETKATREGYAALFGRVRLEARRDNLTHGFEFAPEIPPHNTLLPVKLGVTRQPATLNSRAKIKNTPGRNLSQFN